MLDCLSDGFSDSYFDALTEEDLERIDAATNAAFEAHPQPQPHADVDLEEVVEPGVGDASFPSDIDGLNLNHLSTEELARLGESEATDVEDLDEVEGIADSSFQSDAFGLNLGTLTEEDFANLDAGHSQEHLPASTSGPSILIELEDADEAPVSLTPLEEFRQKKIISVTDLISPSWCEVQYDYGLRGLRHRPLHERPKTFESAAGKAISASERMMEIQDVRTKQGLAVHRELERELNFYELKIDISTEETRWALKLANMIACFRYLAIDGNIIREMPIFGVLHEQVVTGIIDEVVRETVKNPSPRKSPAKRPNPSPTKRSPRKRAKTDSDSSQLAIDAYFSSQDNSTLSFQPDAEKPQEHTFTTLRISDAKTRQNQWLPSLQDQQQGRMQVTIYRKLLVDILANDPPFDFDYVWKTLGLDPTAVFPTNFLVQARLMQAPDEDQSICLNDLVASWRKLVKEAKIDCVSDTLELVYYLRPSDEERLKGKRKAVSSSRVEGNVNREDEDLARAIEASLKEPPAAVVQASGDGQGNEATASGSTSLPVGNPPANLSDLTLDSEDSELQLALRQSLCDQCSEASGSVEKDKVPPTAAAAEVPNSVPKPKPKGVRRFPKIGSATFSYDEDAMHKHIAYILKWWRGERPPEGVPLNRTYRCNTCEYLDDCEWRAAKALELRMRKQSGG